MKSFFHRFRLPLAGLLILILSAAAPALRAQSEPNEKKQDSPVHTPKQIAPPLDIVVPIAPKAFKADGKWHLVYELHVTNLGRWDCLLTRLDVLNGDSAAKTMASFSGADLEGMIVRSGQEVKEKSKMAPGTFAIVYMWVTFDRLEDVPAKITHRIAMKIGDYPEGLTLDGVPVSVDRNPVTVISPPLQGENWVAANGPSNTSAHRRAFIPLNGHAYISQRFAIDWVQANADGKHTRAIQPTTKTTAPTGRKSMRWPMEL